ncbi:MAG TPA: hypothetical protein VGE52_17440, partial [Pirellulales bacterium]
SVVGSVVKSVMVAAVVAVVFGVAAPSAEARGGKGKRGLSNAVSNFNNSGLGRAIKVARPIVRTVLPILLKN